MFELIMKIRYLVLMVFLGVFAAFIPAPILSLPSCIMSAEKLGLGFGIITTLLNVGILLVRISLGL